MGQYEFLRLAEPLAPANSSVNDLAFQFFSSRSGLTPIEKFSISDHERGFLLKVLGLSSSTLSNADLWSSYFKILGLNESSGRAEFYSKGTWITRKNLMRNPSAYIPSTVGTLSIWPGSGGAANYENLTGSGLASADTFRRGTITTAGAGNGGVYAGQGMTAVVPGESYTVSMYIRSSRTTTVRSELRWYADPAAAYSDIQVSDFEPYTANTWQRVVATAVAPSYAKFLWVGAWFTGNTAIGETYDGTAVLVEPAAAYGPVLRTNLCDGPSFETGVAGKWLTNAGAGGVAVQSFPNNNGYAGRNYRRATWTTAATTPVAGQYYGSASIPSASFVPINANSVYSVSGRVRTSLAQKMCLRVYYYSEGGSVVGTFLSPVVDTVANTWVELKVDNAPTPATAVRILTAFYGDASGHNWQIGETLDVDAVIIEEASAVGAFFDGSYAGGAWAGTPYESVSTLQAVVATELRGYFNGNSPLSSWEGVASASVSTKQDWVRTAS